MGNSIFKRLFSDKDVQILIMGHVEQSCILSSLKLGKVKLSMPIEGVFVQTLHYKNVEMSSLDLGSRMSIRPLLPHYFTTIQGLVFTVDCSGSCYRVDETIKEFCSKIEDSEDKLPIDVPILVVAFNHERPEAVTLDDIKERLGKENCFKDRRWIVHGVDITDKDDNDLFEAFEWLTDGMLANEKEKMALNMLGGGNKYETTNTTKKVYHENEEKGFLSKFVESLKKTLVCRPAIK